MEHEDLAEKGVLIEKNYYLMRVFNTINQDKRSQSFVFEGVRFWREDFKFMMSYNGQQFVAGDIVDFDKFKRTLLKRKGKL